MAEQVEEKITELSDVARQKEDFAANFAHELKTPLTSVIGYADMLYQRDLPREQVKNTAEYILNEGMRLETLSLKLMDLFVLNKQSFALEEMAAKDIFDDLRLGIDPVCQKFEVQFHMNIENSTIKVDYDLFKTMMLNLIDNSIKADCKDIWILGKEENGVYLICVKDNGKGIPPEELGKITEAFYMVDKSRSRKQHGAGLGMALVSKIVEIHKAKMKIESDGKTGTEIHISFPSVGEETE
jgi:signal transduction histidine kinase